MLYFLIPNTYFRESFVSPTHYFFTAVMIVYSIDLYCFSMSCHDPGYQTEEPENVEGLYFSEDAGMHCQVRSCYCRICKKIILRRDHHCPWTNHCIGRDNNIYFLSFTTLDMIVSFSTCVDTLYSLWNDYASGQWPFFNVIIQIGVAILSGGTVLITTNLTLQTLRFAMKNLTLWENLSHDKITYLNNYPVGVSPFDKGVVENLKEFFTMREKKTEWKLPTGKANLDAFRGAYSDLRYNM